jgi:hypothetical protein
MRFSHLQRAFAGLLLLITAGQASAQIEIRRRIPLIKPLTLEGLTEELALTPQQVEAVAPMLESHLKLHDRLDVAQFKAPEAKTEVQQAMAALFTEQQKQHRVVQDLLGTYDDHKHMLGVLGIAKLRPGKSGQNQTGPGFDLATANPWRETMPELLKMKDGSLVTKPEQWSTRRKEILEDFEREIYGRVPANAPQVTWRVTSEETGEVGGVATRTRQLTGEVDNKNCPWLSVNIRANYTIPAKTEKPVPVLIAFGPGGLAHAIPSGWGVGTIDPTSIQADSGGNALRAGVIGIANAGQPRKPDDWGALRAWAWGLSRLIDHFEQTPGCGVDPKKVGVTGVSRYGKAAIVAQAFDERVAVGLIGSSGQGGVKLSRHDFGEAVENLTSSGAYHWMAANYLKYGAAEATFGKKDAGDLPVDSHQLLALCAPRPCFISTGVESKGDPKWIGAPGTYMACVLASPAYELLGKKGLEVKTDDYITAPMPAVNQLVGGELAWRQHDGGHTQTPNFPTFFEWVSQHISAQ